MIANMIANPNDGNTPQVEQATPQISVSAGGLITAKTEQEKGYVPGGTKSSTKQLTTQAAKTVTPGTTNQTAVASGRYVTGDVVVAGDANLVYENIVRGKMIFNVHGIAYNLSANCHMGMISVSAGLAVLYYASGSLEDINPGLFMAEPNMPLPDEPIVARTYAVIILVAGATMSDLELPDFMEVVTSANTTDGNTWVLCEIRPK